MTSQPLPPIENLDFGSNATFGRRQDLPSRPFEFESLGQTTSDDSELQLMSQDADFSNSSTTEDDQISEALAQQIDESLMLTPPAISPLRFDNLNSTNLTETKSPTTTSLDTKSNVSTQPPAKTSSLLPKKDNKKQTVLPNWLKILGAILLLVSFALFAFFFDEIADFMSTHFGDEKIALKTKPSSDKDGEKDMDPKKTTETDEQEEQIEIKLTDEKIENTDVANNDDNKMPVEIDESVNVSVDAKELQQSHAQVEEMLAKLHVSLEDVKKTSAEVEAERDAHLRQMAVNTQANAMRLRPDESTMYEKSECTETLPMSDEHKAIVNKIYDQNGGNSVVGNAQQAPFLTFKPGEEPFMGMVPDYDESKSNEHSPLRSGEPHSIMELVSDHCRRNNRAAPQPAMISGHDIKRKQDAQESHNGLKAVEHDGHYIQSQKAKNALMRANRDAVNRIYAKKDAVAAGDLLDANAHYISQLGGEDSMQFVNVNKL